MSGPTATGRPVAPGRQRRILPPARYRHPGDVIRLLAAGLVFAGAAAATLATHGTYAGASATAVIALRLSTTAGRVLTGLMTAAFVVAAVAAIAATLRYRRFRLLASLAGGALLTGAVLIGITGLAGGERPKTLTAGASHWPWLIGPSLASPALGAAVAGVVAAAPWLSRPWRRTAWIALWLAGLAQLLTGISSPLEVILAFAAGVTVGAGVLVLFGVPDRRIGPDEIAAALGSAGLRVGHVAPAAVETKGSRPFVAVADDGTQVFVKVLGSDNRDADLLYRAYRLLRLRDIGDARPAASLIQAVEHQALVAVMTERAGVAVPAVRQVVKTADGSALLAMNRVDGGSLDRMAPQLVTDSLLRALWTEVAGLHRAKIAHRSLRANNIVVDRAGRPWLTDFSFAELAATQRQMALDAAELLASLATVAGADRAVASAAAVIASEDLAAAVPLLQPLALSAGTRRAVAGQDGLLASTRAAAAASGHGPDPELARIQRVRPRTLLTIAALVGAYYFLLPELAKVGNPLPALESAQWAWVLVAIASSALTYLASAIGLLGGVSVRVPFWPTVLTQGASSFVNRVSPSNVGGMALNVRFLQKAGVEPSAGVAAVGVNSLAGALVHLVLLVIFFAWAGRGGAGKAFKLPSSSTLLAVVSVVAAVVGIVIATRQGRNFAARKVLPPLRSSLASLGRVARSPARLTLLFGGSALVTLAYVGGLVASVKAFGGGASIAQIGAVYMAASVVAAATPTPGGVGGFEAAAITGLTGIGISSGVAVSAVVIYRLATYWLPVAPGWVSFRLLQRWDYV